MKYRLATEIEMTELADQTQVGVIAPTVVAESKNGEIKGIMGTVDRQDAVVGGPIIAKSGVIALRLILFYETVLKSLGVKIYLFSVSAKEVKWIHAILKTGRAEIINQVDDAVWFRRALDV